MKQKVIIIGAGGNAKVIADIIVKNSDELIGFLDDNIAVGTEIISGYKNLGKIEEHIEFQKQYEDVKFIISIGDNQIREKIAQAYSLTYYTAIHPTATIGVDTGIQEGTVIMAHASINSNASIGKHCIINTGSIIEHDNVIEDFAHISPNATLGGNVKIGKKTHVGIGATVKNNITIGPQIRIGAGAVVVKDILMEGTYVGVPAKRWKNRENKAEENGGK